MLKATMLRTLAPTLETGKNPYMNPIESLQNPCIIPYTSYIILISSLEQALGDVESQGLHGFWHGPAVPTTKGALISGHS